jgi:hypothetical protein
MTTLLQGIARSNAGLGKCNGGLVGGATRCIIENASGGDFDGIVAFK